MSDDTKQDTQHAREKMDEAVHILKKDVVIKVKAVLDDMYESIDLYETAIENKAKAEVEDDGYAKFHNLPIIGVCGQWVAVFLVGIGIGVEYTLHADIGYVAITAGALVLALATKLKYYRTRR